MSKSLPRLLSRADRSDHDPPLRVAELPDDDVVEIFNALSGESACRVYQSIQESPKTASEIREELGTSIQNIHYHLDNLEDADLIEPVQTELSEKGREMNVYGATHSPLVISFAPQSNRAAVREAISRIVGAIGILGLVSVGVQLLATYGPALVDPGRRPSGNVTAPVPPLADQRVMELLWTMPGLVVFTVGLCLICGYLTWYAVES